MGEAVTVAGLGCRRGVSVAAVLAAVEAARGGRRLDALATVQAKQGERALAEAARQLGLPLLVGAVADGDPRLISRSAASRAATGSGSASEAAALAAAGPAARLVGPRLAVGPVTCAIAVGEDGA
ncbi:MAG TPA: cobalamin biosynthesis protein [Amaricoccus sp.]|nr:cobalamin biosynthesis protein [Amaricoccus sp.]